MKRLLFLSVFCICFILVSVPHSSYAQPTLNFTRIVNNWPTIEIYFKASCNGERIRSFDIERQVGVRENGREINDFTLWCQTDMGKCQVSFSMVFDGSMSMYGAPLEAAQTVGNAFLLMMDGVTDEAAIVWSRSVPVIRQPMTSNITKLKSAIDALHAEGGSAIWDGIYDGVLQLVNDGNNPCRSVIAFTDGNDNGSTHTVNEIIALANRYRIRVYILGYGNVNPSALESIALLTGGKYYQEPGVGQLGALYIEIAGSIIFPYIDECMITYQASCQNGELRTVDLELNNVCEGGNVQTRTYRVPLDTSTYAPFSMTLHDAAGSRNTSVRMPITLDLISSGGTLLGGMALSVHSPSQALKLRGVYVPEGTLFSGATVWLEGTGEHTRVHIETSKYVEHPGTLAELEFDILPGAPVGMTEIRIDSMEFFSGCWHPVEQTGYLDILEDTIPSIIADRTVVCAGGSVTLSCSDGFTDWQWSNGGHTETITVLESGVYSVTARNANGSMQQSPSVEITIFDPLDVGVTPTKPVLCNGEPGWLLADEGYASYEWSTGARTRAILADSPGMYYVDVVTYEGCTGRSDTILVQDSERPSPVISGPDTVCPGSTVYRYETPYQTTSEYYWSIIGGSIVSARDSHWVDVVWNDTLMHWLKAAEITSGSGCSASSELDVYVTNMSPHIQADYLQLCSGSAITLRLEEPYDTYLWNTGDTTATIDVSQPGYYSCIISNKSCSGISDTISIQQIAPVSAQISGNSSVCENERVPYSVAQYDTDFGWDVQGGSIVSGWGSSTIDVVWHAAMDARVICIAQVGACIDRDTLDIVITPAHAPALTIQGSQEFCEGDSVTLSAEPGYAPYLWSTGDTTQSIVVRNTGELFVSGNNEYGCTGYSDTVSVRMHLIPVPVITLNDTILTCQTDNLQYYQWYKDGAALPGDTLYSMPVRGEGVYTVQVTSVFGCTGTSQPYTYSGTGIWVPSNAQTVSIVPNPNSGMFDVEIECQHSTDYTIRVVSIIGEVLYTRTYSHTVGLHREQIALGNTARGLYFVHVVGDGVNIRKPVAILP